MGVAETFFDLGKLESFVLDAGLVLSEAIYGPNFLFVREARFEGVVGEEDYD